MSWIKRNLYFLTGSLVAVALLGLAGFYFYSKWKLNGENLGKLEANYAEWERITSLPISPGNEKVNNIEIAREQQRRVRDKIREVEKYFSRLPPVPNPPNGVVTKEEFAPALRRTIDELQKEADNAGVTLPPKCGFSFEALRQLYNFPPASLGPLSSQLGDIKYICGILFQAKVNSLDGIRRERVSSDDQTGPQTDYLDPSLISVTNELAVLTPYEVTFHCFSAELGGVLGGFAGGPHCVIVKSINVDSTAAAATSETTPEAVAEQVPNPYMRRNMMIERDRYRMRGPVPVAPVPAVAPALKGGLQTVLDETQMKVTLVLNVVKLLPNK